MGLAELIVLICQTLGARKLLLEELPGCVELRTIRKEGQKLPPSDSDLIPSISAVYTTGEGDSQFNGRETWSVTVDCAPLLK